MCESSIFLLQDDQETLMMKDVGWMEFGKDEVLLRDVNGTEKSIHARLAYADLVGHRIVLEPVQPANDD